MSTTADAYLLQRRALARRLRANLLRVARHRTAVVSLAAVGLIGTFVGMLVTGGSGPIGTIMFVPWVALLAAELGPTAGGLAGVAATGLYVVAADTVGLPDDLVT